MERQGKKEESSKETPKETCSQRQAAESQPETHARVWDFRCDDTESHSLAHTVPLFHSYVVLGSGSHDHKVGYPKMGYGMSLQVSAKKTLGATWGLLDKCLCRRDVRSIFLER